MKIYPWVNYDIPGSWDIFLCRYHKISQRYHVRISRPSLGCHGPWIMLAYPMSKYHLFYQMQHSVQNAAGISEIQHE